MELTDPRHLTGNFNSHLLDKAMIFVDEGAFGHPAAINKLKNIVVTAIIGGEAGGPLGMIRQNLVSDFRGVEVKPIEFKLDGRKRAVSIPGMLNYSLDGIESRIGNGEPYYLDNVRHPAGSRLALAITDEIHVDCFGIEFDTSGARNNGHYAPFSWAS